MHQTKIMTTSSSTNEYLKLREEKMARNRSKLERLGLVGPYHHTMSSSSDHPVSSSSTTIYPPRPQKKRDTKSHHCKSDSQESIPMILRRSTRVKNVVSYEEGNLERISLRKRESRTRYDDDEEDHYDHNHHHHHHDDEEENETNKKRRQHASPLSSMPIKVSTERTSEIKPGTTRSISISIVSTLYGNSNQPQDDEFQNSNTNNHHVSSSFIGQYLSTPNKSAVIDHANYHSGNPPGISFNKYSGVCEFSNAIFLWVNNGIFKKEEAGMVWNEFLNGGRQITWYGGSRMTHDSPVIQRLIQLGKESKVQYEKDESYWNSHEYNKGIVLWCRIYDPSMKGSKYTPYICMGRLGYHSHEVNSYPVKFVWDLLDYNRLIQSSSSSTTMKNHETKDTKDENDMSAFERLLRA